MNMDMNIKVLSLETGAPGTNLKRERTMTMTRKATPLEGTSREEIARESRTRRVRAFNPEPRRTNTLEQALLSLNDNTTEVRKSFAIPVPSDRQDWSADRRSDITNRKSAFMALARAYCYKRTTHLALELLTCTSTNLENCWLAPGIQGFF